MKRLPSSKEIRLYAFVQWHNKILYYSNSYISDHHTESVAVLLLLFFSFLFFGINIYL